MQGIEQTIGLEQTISRLLDDGEDLVLATILDQSGSTPRLAGAKMVVRAEGKIAGTIGGGLMEAVVMQSADKLLGGDLARMETFNLTGDDVTSMDMICGGNLQVLLTPIKADRQQRAIFAELAAAMGGGRSAVLVTSFEPDVEQGIPFERCLVLQDGEVRGEITYPETWVTSLADQALREGHAVLQKVEGRRFMAEVFKALPTVYLFGAGHVSQQVAALAKTVDFRVVVLDDRPEFANAQRFPEADETLVPPSFEGVMDSLSINRESYLVIVTRGHRFDHTVLKQALATEAGYVGMIGSRRKRNAIYSALREQGVSQEEIDRVYCPIGLAIGAESPAEIAVSIVGELIQHRVGKE